MKAFWADLDIEKLNCHHCGKPITYDHVLARTFKLARHDLSLEEQPYSEQIQVPSLSETLLVFNRHLECLQSSTRYLAVSHVWHAEVAELQYKHTASPDYIAEAAARLLETPTRICKALDAPAAGCGRDSEVWHDYLSVPQ